MPFDPKKTKGPKWLRDAFQGLYDEIMRNRPVSGIGTMVYDAPGGRPVNAIGGSSTSSLFYEPFRLISTDNGADPISLRIRITASTLGGGSSEDLGFAEGDDPPYLLTPSGSGGFVWGGITVDQTDGTITSRFLDIGASVPEDTATEFYVEIGSYVIDADTLTVSNSRYGPINATICRNWFASESPFYGLSFA